MEPVKACPPAQGVTLCLTGPLVACLQQHAGIVPHFPEQPVTLAEAVARCLPSIGTPGASVHLPVVISIIPVVKVHQKAIVHHVSHCGNTDQGRVHSVHSFKLHAHLEAWGSLVLEEEVQVSFRTAIPVPSSPLPLPAARRHLPKRSQNQTLPGLQAGPGSLGLPEGQCLALHARKEAEGK